ncbi:MAG: LCP family protein [Nitriliruptoraceae bacterium]
MAVPRNLSIRRGHQRPWLRRVVVVVLALVVAGLLWALLLGALWGYAWVRLGGIDLRSLDGDVEPLGIDGAVAPTGTTNLLVSMTAMRDPTRPLEPALMAPVALLQIGGPRADPVVLLLPTDLSVSVDGQGQMTLADIQVSGGSDLLMRAIVDYTGVRVDHVVSVSVEALPRLVDAVDGIELCLADGCRAVTGAQVAAGQFDADPVHVVRIVAGAVHGVARAFDGASMWLAPLTAKRAVDVVAEQIETDVSLRGRSLLDLAEQLAQPVTPVIDVVPVLRHPQTGAVVPLDEPAELRFQHLREGTVLEPGDVEAELRALVLRNVSIAVFNGAGIQGLAASVEERLRDAGVPTVGTGNAPTFAQDRSLVTYRSGDDRLELAAIHVAELLGDVDLEAVDRPPTFEGEEVDIAVTAAADLVEDDA